ncbi:MAG: hypothetical protein EXR93_03575 [Gemmatimonadetes bacterium]|nr:hypothetical protein [Gemmatimonadota bacterium]
MKRMMSVLVGVLVTACGGGGGEKQAPAAAAAGTVAALGEGAITGTVSFKGAPPTNPTIDMSEEPACKAKYPSGSRDPVVAVEGGKLADVFIYVKAGLPTDKPFPVSRAAAPLEQNGCLYHPRVIGVMVNEPVKIVNGDPVLHNIKALPSANRGFNISQPTTGMTTERSFAAAEMAIPLECNVHGWMHAWVFVMPHPYFAVSAKDGAFSISGLPAGTYTIEAWHQKLGTRTATVTVAATGTASAAFIFGA